MLPKGGTAPVRHFVTFNTSSYLAKSTFLMLRTCFASFQLNFLLADITKRIKVSAFKSFTSIALAPLSNFTPLTVADSSLVKHGLWSKSVYSIVFDFRSYII